uniref:receptor-type tyrosine-protein phosphatase alpha-like n=1 Tax=Pristiophorus japonicus TaxID=55135 RepID=UPI00398E632E
TGCDSPRTIRQFHYLQWPDQGVPRNLIAAYRLLKSINQSGRFYGPIIIHCSAGVGRTGTFIAIDYLLKMAEEEGKVDVFQCVEDLRNQRSNMVQTQDQYRLIYNLLLEALSFGDTGMSVMEIGACMKSMAREDPITHGNGYRKEFQTLQTFSQLFQFHHHREGLKLCNMIKNRFPEILPAEHVRPSLMSVRNVDGTCGYINAVFADSYARKDGFIMTQLPLTQTLADFWALVYDHHCVSVVTLSRPQDLDQTYAAFWPPNGSSSYGPFQVTLVSQNPAAGFTERHLALRKLNQSAQREIRVLQLDSWPMEDPVPQFPHDIISILQEVTAWQEKKGDRPVLVAC